LASLDLTISGSSRVYQQANIFQEISEQILSFKQQGYLLYSQAPLLEGTISSGADQTGMSTSRESKSFT